MYVTASNLRGMTTAGMIVNCDRDAGFLLEKLVLGYLNEHEKKETAQLLSGLRIIARMDGAGETSGFGN